MDEHPNDGLHIATGDDRDRRGRREALNTEQTIADAEQSAADVDQTAADIDQTSAERDQDSSDRDRHLSEADQRASDRDQETANSDHANRDRSTSESSELKRRATRIQREQTTAERSRIATARTETALGRFEVAEQRDEAARSRDLAAEARDLAASARDGLAAMYDTASGTVARHRAADDRENAAADREHAAGDRWETRLDRDDLRNALAEAHLDDLTGTYRRAMGNTALRSEIDRAHRSGAPLVMAFLDVDELAGFSDAQGQTAGDELLLDVVKSIRASLRSYDPVVRFGSDEFVCALPDTLVADARDRFASIGDTLAGRRPGATFAVGFTTLEADDTLETMIERGDAALYEAKQLR